MSSHLSRRIALLKQPSFFAYMTGFLFAALGNGVGYIAISWIVATHHPNVSAIAILMACFWGPNVLLGPVMGVIADRFSKKHIIICSNLLRTIIYVAFSLYLRHYFSVSMVYVMMLGVGIAFSAFYSSAFAFMRELVNDDDLIHANATIDIIYELGNVLGMGTAGLLIAWTSAETAILINGIAFFIATFSMLFVTKLKKYPKKHSVNFNIIKDFNIGLRYLYQRKNLLAVYWLQTLILITFLTAPLLLLPFSKTVLHTTVEQFGLIEAFCSFGIITGGLLIPWISELLGLAKTLFFFTLMLCLTFLIFGYNTIIPAAMIMYFIIGFAGAIWPLIISKAQSLTDQSFQGRVQSTFNSISGAAMLIFYFSISAISHHYGIQRLYLIEVIITLLALTFIFKNAKTLTN